MNFITALFRRNKTLTWLGFLFLGLSVFLAILIPQNTVTVLGVNSLIKPLKFAISLWIYSWTMAYLLDYVQNKTIKKRMVFLIVFVMLFEQFVITVQAFRGALSHFNTQTTFENMLFNVMGVLITIITCYTLYVAIKFKKQKDDLPPSKKYAIYYGMVIFVIASFIGGVMGGILSHNVGGEMGGDSLAFVNWSTTIGDIRVAHFIGIHALQIIPLLGFAMHKRVENPKKALSYVRWLSLGYLSFVIFVFVQAMMGLPFIAIG